MAHYLFSYDINTELSKPTLHSDVEKAICQLLNLGFQVKKLAIATTYHIIYPDGDQYEFLVNYVDMTLKSSDARVVLEIAKHNNTNGIMTLWITDKGVPIVCPDGNNND